MFSTGQAAKMCAVTPDTILKWVKAGRIKAMKTAGGHYRIPEENLRPYFSEPTCCTQTSVRGTTYCWEYHAEDEPIRMTCRECVVFKAKAKNCFVIATLGECAGHAGSFCTNTCEDCPYFRDVDHLHLNILIVTDNSSLRDRFGEKAADWTLRFANCGYETAMMLGQSRPDLIILDGALADSGLEEIMRYLQEDPHAEGIPIILAADSVGGKNHAIGDKVDRIVPSSFQLSDLNRDLLMASNRNNLTSNET